MATAISFGIAAFASLFAIVDPFAALPVFLALTGHETHASRALVARRAALTVFAVLSVFALCGHLLFRFFGISIAGFKIAGGILLLGVALDMMRAQMSATKTTPGEEQDAAEKGDVGLVPVGIPLLSGPGAIASSMLLSARADSVLAKVSLYGAIAVVALVCFLVLRSATAIGAVLGRTGMNVINRVMGLILASVAVEFFLDGVRLAFPRLA
ncbi:MAG: MarC family protein [Deltaproteobacteria bacterium]|nr:MarC family protein [Deltaproteobacteria bacterium]